MPPQADVNQVFKLDRFIVPVAARDEFVARTRAIRDFLQTLDGYMENLLLERPGAEGTVNIVTVARWRDAAAFERARAAAAERYRATGFNPAELIKRLGISADMGNYTPLTEEQTLATSDSNG